MKKLVLIKTAIAAALVGGALLTAPAASATTNASPDNGVSCPANFSPSFNGTTLKCVKHVQAQIDNSTRTQCPDDPTFTVFQRMSGNKDICRNAAVDIPSDSNLANFENGQLVITFPVGRVVPGNLLGRPITTTSTGAKKVILRPNADFIFFESSQTANHAALKAAAIETAKAKSSLAASGNTADGHLTGIASVVDGLGGSLDKVNVNLDILAFAQP